MSNLTTRLLVAAVGIPLLLFAAFLGGWPLRILILFLQCMLAREWNGLTRKIERGTGIITFVPAILAVDALIWGQGSPWVTGLAVLAFVLWFLYMGIRSPRSILHVLSSSVLFLIYAVLPLALWSELGDLSAGVRFGSSGPLIALFLATWFSDSGAYFTGRLIGRRKLWPAASPKKTVEGAVGGLLFAAVPLLLLHTLGWVQSRPSDWIALAICAGIIGQAGDLIESLIKRDAGVKDSSQWLPGHGGFLDRFDSLLFSTPAFFAYLILFP